MEIHNVDDLVNEYVPKKAYRNKNPLSPQWPFRMLLVAPSGAGKTNVVMNLVLNYLDFDRIYIYIKDIAEDKYVFLISYFQALEKQFQELNGTDEQIIWFSDDPKDIVPLDELDPEYQSLVIFDDAVTDKKANETISDMFIRGRKRNCSLIYQTQSLFDVPKKLRLNANYVLLFGVSDQNELQSIGRKYATSVDYQTFKKLFAECVNIPYGFMLLDQVTTKAPLKIRCGFDGLLAPPSSVTITDMETGKKL